MDIKNVVFDFGQVLVHFEPEYMAKKYVNNEADARLLETVVFDRLYWDKLDKGTISDEEVLDECKKRLPENLWALADKIYYNWIYNIPEIEGMRELIVYIKEKYHVRLFVLSNISKYFASHKNEIPVFSEFEQCILSATIGKTKPNRDIFEYLCEKCNITPQQTVFVDDNRLNIDAANSFGIKGYLFDGNVPLLKSFFDDILSNSKH